MKQIIEIYPTVFGGKIKLLIEKFLEENKGSKIITMCVSEDYIYVVYEVKELSK